MSAKWVLRTGLSLLIVCLASTVHAQEQSDSELAETLFREGAELIEMGRTEAALASFQRSYQLAQVNIVLYNIGICQQVLGRSAAALSSFERYLSEGGDRIPEERRQSVQAAIVELRAELNVDEAAEDPDASSESSPETTEETEPGEHSDADLDSESEPGADRERVALHRRWWFWTLVGGAVAAGLGVGLGVGLTRNPDPPASDIRVNLP